MLSLLCLFSIYFLETFANCPSGQVLGPNGNCYMPYKQKVSWYQAEDLCAQKGGHLASIRGGIISGFLEGVADLEFPDDYWVGGSTNGNNKWTWSDAKEFKFQNWAIEDITKLVENFTLHKGYPVTSAGYCIAIRRHDAKWTSSTCDQLKPFICEFGNNQPIVPIVTSTIRTACPDNWMYSPPTRKCYLAVIDSDITWLDAQNACRQRYADASLVTIHSLAENSLVAGYAAAATSYEGYSMWIGLYSSVINGNYKWVGGSPYNFSHFYLYDQSHGLYAYLVLLDDLDDNSDEKSFCMLNRWMSTDGHGVNGYICEKPAL